MKKRIWIQIISTLVLAAMAFSLVSCTGPEPTVAPTEAPVEKKNVRYIEDCDTREYLASDDEFKTLKADKINLIACEIEAAKGKIFEDETIQNYFENQEWYTPNENYSQDLLSETAKKNLFVFKTMYDIKMNSYTEVGYVFSLDLVNNEDCGTNSTKAKITPAEANENVTIVAAEDKKSFTISIEGIKFCPDESNATPTRATVEETVEVRGELTGKAYLAALVYQSGAYQIIVESKDGDTYYNKAISYYFKTAAKREKTKQLMAVSEFIGNINDPEQVSFFLKSGNRRVDTFIANYESTMFAGFVHQATLTVTNYEIDIKKAEMKDWGKEFTVIADINIYKSKLEKDVIATAKAGETWKVLQCDDDGLMLLCKADDESVKGYLEFTTKGKAIVGYSYENGNEKKTTGDKLSTYFQGMLVE